MMFSSRLNWGAALNPLLETLAAKRAAGIEIIDLTESNPTRAGFDYPWNTILPAFAQPAASVYEPSPRGLSAARLAVADYYRDRGSSVDPDSLFLTASTSEAYSFLFKLFTDPGDEILVPQPGYPLFDFLTALDSVRPISYRLNYDELQGWQINFERLRAACLPCRVGQGGPRTRAIIVVSPHNPTGAYLKESELAELNMLCAERNLALIVDEVFWDYPSSVTAPVSAIGNSGALTFVLSGLSKVAGLPQMKLGWIQISGPAKLCAAVQARLDFIADTYLSVAAPVQHAAPTLLANRRHIQEQIRARLDANDEWLKTQCIGATTHRVLRREGGWYAILEFQDAISDEERVQQLLERENVFVHPGYFYDFAREGYLVLSLLTPPETFQSGIEKILDRGGK